MSHDARVHRHTRAHTPPLLSPYRPARIDSDLYYKRLTPRVEDDGESSTFHRSLKRLFAGDGDGNNGAQFRGSIMITETPVGTIPKRDTAHPLSRKLSLSLSPYKKR